MIKEAVMFTLLSWQQVYVMIICIVLTSGKCGFAPLMALTASKHRLKICEAWPLKGCQLKGEETETGGQAPNMALPAADGGAGE